MYAHNGPLGVLCNATLAGRKGADLDAEFEASVGRWDYLTWAAEYHRVDLVEVLLARDADREKKPRVDRGRPRSGAKRPSEKQPSMPFWRDDDDDGDGDMKRTPRTVHTRLA